MGRIQLGYSTPYDQLIDVTKDVQVSSRVWVRNGVGTAQVYVPYSYRDWKNIITYGNILRMREYGVPTWTGVVVSREWTGNGFNIGCKSAEWLLSGKITGQGRVYGAQGGSDAGSVASDLLYNALANCDVDTIHPGSFRVTKKVFREYNYADLLDAWSKLADDTGADFWVDDQLRAHFLDLRGTDKRSTVILREGRQLTDVRVVEGIEDFYNAIIGLGDGSKVMDKPKLLLKRPNTWLFRAKTLDVNGATTPDAMNDTVRQELENCEPTVAVDANVVKGTKGYGSFWLGDIITLVLKHPLYHTVQVKVNGLELGSENSMRGVFDVIDPLGEEAAVAWSTV